MVKRNRELFYKIAAQLDREPESYDQETWGRREAKTPCGTAHCVAGWAAALGGYKSSTKDSSWSFVVTPEQLKLPTSKRMLVSRNVETLGAELLGLTEGEADALFDCGWEPGPRETVPEALRAIGDGAPVNTEHMEDDDFGPWD